MIKRLYNCFLNRDQTGKDKIYDRLFNECEINRQSFSNSVYRFSYNSWLNLFLNNLKENNISTLRYQHNANKFYKSEKLVKNKYNKITTIFDEIVLLLYVNDGALIFNLSFKIILGNNIIYQQISKMELNILIGKDNIPFKIETIYFPSRSKMSSRIIIMNH